MSHEMLLSLGAETVLIVERNMSSTDMRGAAALPGSKSRSHAEGARRKLGDPASDHRQKCRPGPHREGEEP